MEVAHPPDATTSQPHLPVPTYKSAIQPPVVATYG